MYFLCDSIAINFHGSRNGIYRIQSGLFNTIRFYLLSKSVITLRDPFEKIKQNFVESIKSLVWTNKSVLNWLM